MVCVCRQDTLIKPPVEEPPLPPSPPPVRESDPVPDKLLIDVPAFTAAPNVHHDKEVGIFEMYMNMCLLSAICYAES